MQIFVVFFLHINCITKEIFFQTYDAVIYFFVNLLEHIEWDGTKIVLYTNFMYFTCFWNL